MDNGIDSQNNGDENTGTTGVNQTTQIDPSFNQTKKPAGGFIPTGPVSILINLGVFILISLLTVAFVFAAFKIILARIRVVIHNRSKVRKYQESVILEISVPKETAEQVQKEMGSGGGKDAKDMLQVGEQLFNIMSQYSKKGFKNWLYGGERFSLEIVNVDQEIRFWMVCSTDVSSVIERQIIAIYSKAHIVKVKKTNFFKENYQTHSQELELSTRFELPIKTYRHIDSDPLNNLTSALTGLSVGESCAIQLILEPVENKAWQKKSNEMALKIQQGQNPKDILFPETDYFKGFWKIVKDILKEIKGPGKKTDDPMKQKESREIDLSGKKIQIQLTPQQQEIIKKLEEKASKPGFKFTLRITACAETKERAKTLVNGIIPSFQIFDVKPFNGFKKVKKDNKNGALDYLLRSPALNNKQIINAEEINSLWHLPGHQVQTANIKWLLGRRPPLPLYVPPSGGTNVYLGKGSSRGVKKDIYMTMEDRFRHIYSLGGSGSGKTVTMNNVALQDIKMGNGICVIDPHGESIDDILRRVPPERIKDIIVFSPSITDRPLGLNMLESDPLKPTQKTLVIETLFAIWDKLYDLKKTGGPMFESYMKNSMRLVMSHPESGCTMMEIPKVLVDEDFRSFKLAMCEEQEVKDFWEKEATKAGGEASLENMVPYITSKLAPFITNDFIRPMIGQTKSVINFRQAMDNKKIVLVSLSKGLIGESSAYLIGMVIVGGVLMAGMGRSDGLKYNMDGTTDKIIPSQRPPFFVYIDEMQNFLFDAIPKALEEIRKYKVGFYLAHQFVKQVVVDGNERIKDSIMANCATKFIFRCGAEDAKFLETEFYPLTNSDIQNPEKQTFNAICLINAQRSSPFNIEAFYKEYFEIEGDGEKMKVAEKQKNEIMEMVKQTYGRDREEVEKEIKERGKIFF